MVWLVQILYEGLYQSLFVAFKRLLEIRIGTKWKLANIIRWLVLNTHGRKMIQNNFNKELERKIDLYVNGKLNSDQADELWAELIQDDYYLDYMKSVANLKAVIEESKSGKPKTVVYAVRKYVSYAAAAAAVVIAAVVGVMNYSATGNTEMLKPLTEIGLDVVRSTESAPDDVIRKAIQLAANGETEDAISLLETELEVAKNPEFVADLALSLGSILYNNAEYQSAIAQFQTVIEQEGIESNVLEKGYWYLGHTYFQLNELELAESAFQRAYDLDGSFSRAAKSYIDAFSALR